MKSTSAWEYYHEGKEDQCFVCGIEKASVIEEELKMCGYFCIITSAEMTAKEALDLYKSRDASEKLFKADKSFLGNRSLRVYTGESLEGKMLIAFVALIIRNRMYTKLKDAEEEMLRKTELHERTGIYSGTGKNRNGPAGRRCIPVGSCRYPLHRRRS
jgi:transposase